MVLRKVMLISELCFQKEHFSCHVENGPTQKNQLRCCCNKPGEKEEASQVAVPEVRSCQSGYILKIKSTDVLIEWTEGVKEREDQS